MSSLQTTYLAAKRKLLKQSLLAAKENSSESEVDAVLEGTAELEIDKAKDKDKRRRVISTSLSSTLNSDYSEGDNYSALSNKQSSTSASSSSSRATHNKSNTSRIKQSSLPPPPSPPQTPSTPTPKTPKPIRPKQTIPPSIPQTLTDSLQTLKQEIQTSGLRQNRETSLLSLLRDLSIDLVEERKDLNAVFKTWVMYGEECSSDVSRSDVEKCEVLDLCGRLRGEFVKRESGCKNEIKSKDDEVCTLKENVEALEEGICRVREEWENDVIVKNEEYEQRMKEEMKRIKIKERNAATAKGSKALEIVQNEHNVKLKTIQAQLADLTIKHTMQTKENKHLKNEVMSLTEDLKSNYEYTQREIEERDRTVEELTSSLQSSHNENEHLLNENNAYEVKTRNLTTSNVNALNEQREHRKNDLLAVESKVKEVIKRKDQEVMMYRDRCEGAEGRVRELEEVLRSLEDGFQVIE